MTTDGFKKEQMLNFETIRFFHSECYETVKILYDVCVIGVLVVIFIVSGPFNNVST